MNLDPTIREQTYQYFLQEAPELLQAIEQGLFHLRSNWGINQVNNLMRATHTLKGAATSVGLDTIARIAHSLEDIFKALCQPGLALDPDVEALLFEGLECLRLPLIAELNGGSVDHADVLNRTASVFALLQEKLGDCFAQEPYLPTSADLGFDLTQSMFELGVAQRLEQMAAILQEGEPDTVATELRTHTEVLLGLAESLNLPGFAAIAKSTIAALQTHPDEATTIGQAAIADFWRGHAAVMAGDRTQGGEPSEQLQQFVTPVVSDFEREDLPLDNTSSLLESIWGSTTTNRELIGEEPSYITAVEVQAFREPDPPVSEPSVHPVRDPIPQGIAAPLPSVRVAVKHLERFNDAVGEFLTHQNRQSLQIEQLQIASTTLLSQVKRHQQLLAQWQERINCDTHRLQRAQTQKQPSSHSPTSRKTSRRSKKERLRGSGTLENPINDANILQSLLDQTVQLTETAEAIHLLTGQGNQLLEKQHHLLTSTQDALIQARMLPLNDIFGRFPHTLQQLETLHSKPVALKLQGGDVWVDKIVAEKLFDPLLHLIRNAFDHGIEAPAIRRQRGKGERGLISLSAYHQGRHLVIEVQDDGNGLDFDQIRQRAVQQQRVSVEQANRLSQEQLADLLFEPGFSTAAQVSDLSGRGVGLDVVRNQSDTLQGTVTVRSEQYRGTTFTLRIPLNLTIAQLFVCEADRRTYALLDSAIEQILIPQSSQVQERNGGRFLRWNQGEDKLLIPIYSLTEALVYEAPSPTFSPPSADAISVITPESTRPVILIRCQNQLLGLEVDRLVSEQKLVIRPLGAVIHAPQYVQGATTLADGKLALVIDVITLLQRVVDDAQANRSASHWTHPVPAILPPSESPLLPQSAVPPALAPELRAASNAKILIIEDSITTRQSLKLTLEKAGYQVLQAQDGREGLDRFQQQPDVRCVVCDLEMPGMNGFEFLRQRQQIAPLADIPVLILSSRSDEQHRLLASQLGATIYMVKPFMEQKLLKIIASLLEQTQLNTIAQ